MLIRKLDWHHFPSTKVVVFAGIQAVLFLALFVGMAGPGLADEIEPEPPSDAPVAEKPAPDAPSAPTQPAQTKEPASHVHEVNPVPSRSFKEVVKDTWTRDKLFGDWKGLRTDLYDHGIDIGLRLSQYGQGVASGGVQKSGEYGARMSYRVHADLAKAVGLWEGLSIDLHAMTRFGEDILADTGGLVIPNTELLMPLPGKYSDSDITGLTLTQDLFGGRAAVFAGKLDVIDLVSGFFPQIGFGQEGFLNVNSLVTAMPWFGSVRGLSLWGAGAWTIENGMVGSGFIAAGTDNVTTTWEFSDSFKHGVFMAGWYRAFWELGDMPGYFLVFAGGSTRDQVSVESLDFVYKPGAGITITDNEKKPWDIAAYVYQVFWEAENDPNRKATFFVGGTGGPDDPQFSNWNVFAAVEAFGPVASRPHDRMGVSGWYNSLSDDFVDILSGLPINPIYLRDTWGFELYYNIEINKWLHLTSDLQLVKNEFKGDNMAIIPGIRMVIDF